MSCLSWLLMTFGMMLCSNRSTSFLIHPIHAARRTSSRLFTATAPSEDWREAFKRTVNFPTWVVPSPNCQTVLSSEVLQDWLGSLDHLTKRMRLVRSYNETHQLILRSDKEPLSIEARALLESLDVDLEGPAFAIDFNHTDYAVPYILQHVLPEEVHPPPTAYEQVGHVAHLNLKQLHEPYRHVIGQVLVECVPNIETVVQKVGQVSGDYRTYDMELLAGTDDYQVKLLEHNIKLSFDLRESYWCSRLSGERSYMLKHVFQKNQTIADVFCGVGAQCIQAASKLQCKILVANDWNPKAVEALKANVASNNVKKYFPKICSKDAYDVLVDIGLGDVMPHHVMMNFPLDSPTFLEALRWWPSQVQKKDEIIPTFHVYTFSHGAEAAADVAIDLVANALLPVVGAAEVPANRVSELDKLGCEVNARVIRDVAPGKVVVCVSFKATKRLIRHVQGDFM